MHFNKLAQYEREDLILSVIKQFPEGLIEREIVKKFQHTLGVGMHLRIVSTLNGLIKQNKLRKINYGKRTILYKMIKEE